MSDETLPAVTEDEAAVLAGMAGESTGLEDFDTTDFVMPRLKIDGPSACFVDQQSKESFPKLEVILLGLVKQRILWDEEVDEGDKPLCKSPNFNEGFPDVERFPWAQAGFSKTEDPLPCQNCTLAEWGTHPKGKTPWCTEQHTYPLLMVHEDQLSPAILTAQRSGIKASRSYLSSFARSKTPTFTVVTELSLTAQKRGSVQYAVPGFKKLEKSDKDQWGWFAEQYRSIREYLTQPPQARTDDDEEVTPKASAPGGGTVDDSDIPF